MCKRKVDLLGKTIGNWEVLSEGSRNKYNQRRYLCKCVCGKERLVLAYSLNAGKTKSCGCLNKNSLSHGMSNTRPYTIWSNMLSRCYNSNNPYYFNYGGRGIEVCDDWKNSFESFWEDMQQTYGNDLELNRIDNDGKYCKQNCNWVTREDNQANKRKQRETSSKHRNVSWSAERRKWCVYVSVNGKYKFVGRFESEVEAAKARDNFVVKNSLNKPLNF